MSAAQHTPGLYGRPGIRERDGVTLSTVDCRSGDSDCAFPNCGCPASRPDAREPLTAARAVVAMTFAEAQGSGGRLLYCQCDALNPCWDNRPDDVPGKHWGGGVACTYCNLRALIAKATGSAA